MTNQLEKVLIANRSEIAVRISRTCQERGIDTVAIYENNELDRPHPYYCDEAYELTNNSNHANGYMDAEQIVRIANDTGADAIHPGYGFLSENPRFPRICRENDVHFIGPSETAINMAGNKMEARNHAEQQDVPVIPGLHLEEPSADQALKEAKDIGFPLMIKAASGGGGRGIRIAENEDSFQDTFHDAKEESRKAFDSEKLFLERFFPEAHHIEIQVLGDGQGNVIHLGERECSIQRRHQKLIEESPSPFINREKRNQIGQYAVDLMEAIDYEGAGTVEFLVDPDQNAYFLEINPRLQVEHPATELCTGLDLVGLQLEVARHQSLPLQQSDLIHRGHAIECRICAEDPYSNFLPTAGTIPDVSMPEGPFVRVDSGIQSGTEVTTRFDSMLAKIITWGPSRDMALDRMHRALSETDITGIKTTIPLYLQIMNEDVFRSGEFTTKYLENRSFSSPAPSEQNQEDIAELAARLQFDSEHQSLQKNHPQTPDQKQSNWFRSGLRRQMSGRS